MHLKVPSLGLKWSKNILSSLRYSIAHVVGSNQVKFIEQSTSCHLRNMVEKYSSQILINSYDQNQQLTYQQVL